MIWVLPEHHTTVTLVPESLYNFRDHRGERLTPKSVEESVPALERILPKNGIRTENNRISFAMVRNAGKQSIPADQSAELLSATANVSGQPRRGGDLSFN